MDEARAGAGPATRLVGVIGSPIAHSLSPLLHNAAFVALGLGDTWHSLAFDVPPGQAAEALATMRRADISGLSVTMPHKADVAALVDQCTAVARRLGAVNCIVNWDGVLLGTNTDGAGFVASLARGAAFAPAGKRCLVIGAGGAARAVILALAEAGASQVAVLNRTPARAATAAELAGPAGSVVAAGESALVEAVQAADLVVNATPFGMAGASPPGTQPWLVAPGAAPVGSGGRRPGLRPPPDALAACRSRGGCAGRRRARHAGAPGRGAARTVDGGAGPGRGHVAGRGGGRSPCGLRPLRPQGRPGATWARSKPWPTLRAPPHAARGSAGRAVRARSAASRAA